MTMSAKNKKSDVAPPVGPVISLACFLGIERLDDIGNRKLGR